MIALASAERADSLAVAFALDASGLSVLGDKPLSSLAVLHESPSSWWVDPLNEGVFFETNPHRPSGRYLHPEPTASSVVVMTPEGVPLSDPAYLDRVVVVVRPWRSAKEPLEWLSALYDQLADSSLRRYPTWIRVAETLQHESQRAAADFVSFLGNGVEVAHVEAAFAGLQVLPRLHDDHIHAAVFDELYDVLRDGTELSDALVEGVNEVLAIE
ncbi:MAG: hypothetical protein AB8H86_30730 [Polyangiales bacterium]